MTTCDWCGNEAKFQLERVRKNVTYFLYFCNTCHQVFLYGMLVEDAETKPIE